MEEDAKCSLKGRRGNNQAEWHGKEAMCAGMAGDSCFVAIIGPYGDPTVSFVSVQGEENSCVAEEVYSVVHEGERLGDVYLHGVEFGIVKAESVRAVSLGGDANGGGLF